MPLIQSQAGAFPSVRQTSGSPNNPGGTFGEGCLTELNPAYYQLTKLGRAFSLAVQAVNPTAFAGASGGTPVFGWYNPAGSGVDLVMCFTSLAARTGGTAAQTNSMGWWGVSNAAAPTGTQTVATNNYTLAKAGSVAYCMSNTANTGSSASSFIRASVGLIAPSAATQFYGAISEDLRGTVVCPPGGYVAWGMSGVALTAGSFDFSAHWVEVPA